jgi:thymidylate kinase
MAADGSVNIPRIKPGDNIEAVNTALTAVERSLSEVREAAAAAKPTADIVSNLDNALKAMKAEQAELVQRIAARDALTPFEERHAADLGARYVAALNALGWRYVTIDASAGIEEVLMEAVLLTYL